MMGPLLCEGTHQGDTDSSSLLSLGGAQDNAMAVGKSILSVKHSSNIFLNFVMYLSHHSFFVEYILMLHFILCRCGHAEAWGRPLHSFKRYSGSNTVPFHLFRVYMHRWSRLCPIPNVWRFLAPSSIFSWYRVRPDLYKHSGMKKIYAKLAPSWTCDIQTIVLFK